MFIVTVEEDVMDDIEMKAVISSNIDSIGYDYDRNELHVKFSNGGYYIYRNVNKNNYIEMLEATSIGNYMRSYIKPFHVCEKVN
jgi:hypothetical protein